MCVITFGGFFNENYTLPKEIISGRPQVPAGGEIQA